MPEPLPVDAQTIRRTSTSADALEQQQGATVHWHAYAYREGPADVYSGRFPASVDGDHWLIRHAEDIAETFEDPEAAALWMKAQLAECPPKDPTEFGYVHASVYTRNILWTEAHKDAMACYEDRSGWLVVRLLVPCPRPAVEWWPGRTPPPCPDGRS